MNVIESKIDGINITLYTNTYKYQKNLKNVNDHDYCPIFVVNYACHDSLLLKKGTNIVFNKLDTVYNKRKISLYYKQNPCLLKVVFVL